MNYIHITKENIDREHICCAMSGKQSLAKKEWLRQRFDEGLVFYRSGRLTLSGAVGVGHVRQLTVEPARKACLLYTS